MSVRTMTNVEAAWMGASVTCDGWITYADHSRRGKAYWYARIGVVNSDLEIMSACLRLTGVGGVMLHGSGVKRPVWTWEVGAQQEVLGVLRQIEPYLAGKQMKAQATIWWLENGRPGSEGLKVA